MADPTYLSQTAVNEALSDSEQEVAAAAAGDSPSGVAVKQQQVYIWSDQFEKWHECKLSLSPPYLHITEHEDARVEINEKQLLHLQQRWFHGNLCRRDAKYILQDNGGGKGSFLVRASESYQGKFAISFVYESKVKHVVVESKPDPVTGVVYHVTPSGPYFDSLYSLVEEARRTKVIQNHLFDVLLTKCPPKPDQTWLHNGVHSLSQAEQIMRNEQRDGAFFVYRTSSSFAPYSLVYRSNGNIRHAPIMTSNRSSNGYNLSGVSAPVLYKLIHYFMENPIHGDTILQYPLEESRLQRQSYAIAIQDYNGDASKNELTFSYGALISDITRKSAEWCVGNHRGDRQKFFPANTVRFLSRDEITYIEEVRSGYQDVDFEAIAQDVKVTTHLLDLQRDYSIQPSSEDSTVFHIHPTNPKIRTFRSFKISCPNSSDVERWYQALQQNECFSPPSPPVTKCDSSASPQAIRKSRRTKKGTCIVS